MRLSGRLGFSPSGDWASGNPAFAISRGSPGTPSRTHRQRLPVSWHAIVPDLSFRITGQPSDPKTPPPVHARYAGYIAVRLVAHADHPVMRPADCWRRPSAQRPERRVSARLSRALHRWLRRESTLQPYERLARLHIYASAALDSNRIPTFNAVIGSRSTART